MKLLMNENRKMILASRKVGQKKSIGELDGGWVWRSGGWRANGGSSAFISVKGFSLAHYLPFDGSGPQHLEPMFSWRGIRKQENEEGKYSSKVGRGNEGDRQQRYRVEQQRWQIYSRASIFSSCPVEVESSRYVDITNLKVVCEWSGWARRGKQRPRGEEWKIRWQLVLF